ncbi:hypothetical protein P2123_005653, partial [Citrobacter freundii]
FVVGINGLVQLNQNCIYFLRISHHCSLPPCASTSDADILTTKKKIYVIFFIVINASETERSMQSPP